MHRVKEWEIGHVRRAKESPVWDPTTSCTALLEKPVKESAGVGGGVKPIHTTAES